MLLTRERPLAPAALLLPAALPSLRDALQSRAAAFGPFDGDPAVAAPRGLLARCAAARRRVGDTLDPPRTSRSFR